MKRSFNLTLALATVALTLAPGATAFAAEKHKKAAAAAAAAAAANTASAVSPGNSFDAFRLIVERNIFNPNRIGRTRATTDDKPPRVDEIALVGTMNYDKGLVAFFESTDTSFRKTVREGETIADFKVDRITGQGVQLSRGEKTLALKVAQELRRAEGGEWAVTAAPEAARPEVGGPPTPTAPVAAPEIPADASEVLKRLLKKRDKQLK